MNYEQTSYDIRAEIARLEREHGPKQAWGATFRLLQALEHLQAANRSLPRLMASRQRELSNALAGIYEGPGGPLHGDGREVRMDLDASTEAAKPCARCGGSGWIQGQPTTYETDSREEVALAWEMARYPCPECSK